MKSQRKTKTGIAFFLVATGITFSSIALESKTVAVGSSPMDVVPDDRLSPSTDGKSRTIQHFGKEAEEDNPPKRNQTDGNPVKSLMRDISNDSKLSRSARSIHISSDRGKITLKGVVQNRGEHKRILEKARSYISSEENLVDQIAVLKSE